VSYSRSTPVANSAERQDAAYTFVPAAVPWPTLSDFTNAGLDHLAYMHGEARPGSTAPVAGAS
jgi:hypothetical protein